MKEERREGRNERGKEIKNGCGRNDWRKAGENVGSGGVKGR